MMTFSIIVPIYGVELYLSKCIESILNQTYQDFELILVDDGSLDNSGKICDEFALKDSRIKVIHKSNGGSTSARKAGCLIAKNDFIVCVDGDDYIRENYLETINNEYEEDVDMYCIGYNDDKGIFTSNYQKPGTYESEYIYKRFLTDENREFYNYGCLIYALWAKIIRRDIYVNNQMKASDRLVMGEDLYCSSLCVRDSKKIKVLDYYGYIYRTNPTSITQSFKEIRIKQYYDIIIELHSIYHNDLNKVYLYSYNAYILLVSNIAKNATTFKAFKEKIKNDSLLRKIKEFGLKGIINKSGIKTKLKIFLDKHNMFLLMYLIYKIKK